MMTAIIAYTYDADVHCAVHARDRFGVDAQGDIMGVDSEGNDVGIIAPWDEWHVCSEHLDSFPGTRAALACSDCGDILAEHACIGAV